MLELHSLEADTRLFSVDALGIGILPFSQGTTRETPMGMRDDSILRTGQITQRTVELLLVEDDPSEIRLMQLALKGVPIPTHLSAVEDGDKALALLRGHRPYKEARRPALILISLKLPGIDGLELLAELKGDPALCAIPALVFTSSASPAHIRQSYALHANCYIIKPTDADAFFSLVQEVVEFWCGIVELPVEG
jgi:two-component system, chemotaxis family, response regulator Rcp1